MAVTRVATTATVAITAVLTKEATAKPPFAMSIAAGLIYSPATFRNRQLTEAVVPELEFRAPFHRSSSS